MPESIACDDPDSLHGDPVPNVHGRQAQKQTTSMNQKRSCIFHELKHGLEYTRLDRVFLSPVSCLHPWKKCVVDCTEVTWTRPL